MKNFLEYAKNRFLYNFLKILSIMILGLVAGKLFLFNTIEVKADNEQFWSKTNLARFADGQWTQIGSKTSTSDTIQLTGIYEYDYYPYSISVYGSKLTPFATDMIYNLSFRVTYPSTNLFNWKKAMQVASPNLTITNVNVKYCTLNTNTDYYSEWTCQFTVGENAGSYYDIGVDWYNYILSNQGLGYLLDSYNQSLTISLVLTSNKDYNGQIVSQNEVIIGQNSQILDQQRKNLEEQQKTNEKLDTAENTRKGIWETIKSFPSTFSNFFKDLGDKIGNFFTNLLNGIIDGLKSLFIPSDGFFKDWFNGFKTYVEDKLGFLATPFTIFIDFIESYSNLSSSNDIILNIPDISVPNFEDYKIISSTTFNWSQTLKSKTSLLNLWNLYLDFIDVFLMLNFIGLCEKVYNRIFGGDTSNYEYYTTEDSYNYDESTGEVLSGRHTERVSKRKKAE